jgi:hypothetical protein
MGNLGRALGYVRKNGLAILREIVINIAAPLAIYTYTKTGLGEVQALMLSSAPPIAWSVIEFIRHRRIDAISIMVIASIVLSLAGFVGGGGVRFLQMREKLVTVLIGLIFLGSAAIGRPLIFEFARATIRRRSAAEAETFEAMRENAGFRRTMTLMTLVWGFGLVAEAGLSAFLVFHMSVPQFMVVSRFIGYGTVGLLALWSVWFVRRQRRKGDARRAAEAAAAAVRPASENAS